MRFTDIKQVSEADRLGTDKEDVENIMTGVYVYGLDFVNDLLHDAAKQGKKLVFFYADEEALENDQVNFKFTDDE